jgi:hypothetical protein
LPDHVVRVSHEVHQKLDGGKVGHLVALINHYVFIEGGWCPLDDPFEAAGVEILQFLRKELFLVEKRLEFLHIFDLVLQMKVFLIILLNFAKERVLVD